MAVFDLMTMRDHLDQGTALLIFRLGAVTVSAFGILGLTLAAVGLFALVSFSVSQRRREFGIRSALGAQTTEVVLLVVRRGLMLTALGIVSGIAVSLALTRFMSALLLGVSPMDPAVFTAITALLTAVALLACLIPARRALRVDPLDVLRAE